MFSNNYVGRRWHRWHSVHSDSLTRLNWGLICKQLFSIFPTARSAQFLLTSIELGHYVYVKSIGFPNPPNQSITAWADDWDSFSISLMLILFFFFFFFSFVPISFKVLSLIIWRGGFWAPHLFFPYMSSSLKVYIYIPVKSMITRSRFLLQPLSFFFSPFVLRDAVHVR